MLPENASGFCYMVLCHDIITTCPRVLQHPSVGEIIQEETSQALTPHTLSSLTGPHLSPVTLMAGT